MNTTHKAIIMLLRSGITGEKLQLPGDADMEAVRKIIGRQSVATLVYQGAVNCGMDASLPLMRKLFAYYCRALMRSELQMQAVERIYKIFEENEIPFVPLKGCNIKKLYPKPELRPMGDADILIRVEDHQRIASLMVQLGFEMIREDDHVFEWHSAQLHVELHKSLVPPMDEDYFAYYGDGWAFAVKGEGYRHDLSVEDAYVFLFAHFARHYRGGGIGSRHVVDLYVYRCAYPDMNMEYISGELRKLRLLEFHYNMMKLLDVWFRDCEEDPVTQLATSYIFSGGSWGSMEAEMYSREVKAARKAGGVKKSGVRAVLHALFPSRQSLAYRYCAVRKSSLLVPVFWVVRWLDILFLRPRKIRRRLEILKKVNNEGVLSYGRALEMVGLEFSEDV